MGLKVGRGLAVRGVREAAGARPSSLQAGCPSQAPDQAAEPGHLGVRALPQAARPAARKVQPGERLQGAETESRHGRQAGQKKAAALARAQRRKEKAAERRVRERARKQAAKTRPRTTRPRGDSHEPGACGNRDCPKYGCVAYWRGQDNCPIPHEGE